MVTTKPDELCAVRGVNGHVALTRITMSAGATIDLCNTPDAVFEAVRIGQPFVAHEVLGGYQEWAILVNPAFVAVVRPATHATAPQGRPYAKRRS